MPFTLMFYLSPDEFSSRTDPKRRDAFWGAFVMYPAPGPGFDYPSVGVPANWPHL